MSELPTWNMWYGPALLLKRATIAAAIPDSSVRSAASAAESVAATGHATRKCSSCSAVHPLCCNGRQYEYTIL